MPCYLRLQYANNSKLQVSLMLYSLCSMLLESLIYFGMFQHNCFISIFDKKVILSLTLLSFTVAEPGIYGWGPECLIDNYLVFLVSILSKADHDALPHKQ